MSSFHSLRYLDAYRTHAQLSVQTPCHGHSAHSAHPAHTAYSTRVDGKELRVRLGAKPGEKLGARSADKVNTEKSERYLLQSKRKLALLKMPMTQVTTHLFVSGVNQVCVTKLLENNISHVLSVIDGIPLQTQRAIGQEGILHKKLPFRDKNAQELARVIDECTDWINQVIQGGGNVLVHCFLGLSRSPAIIIAYLMKYQLKDYVTALEMLRSGQPKRYILPHPELEKFLRKEWKDKCLTKTAEKNQ